MTEPDQTGEVNPAEVLTPSNKTELRRLLWDYGIATFEALSKQNEWPRPSSAPLTLEGHWYQLPEAQRDPVWLELQKFLSRTGVRQLLRMAGHQWFWHHEVFEHLLLELYARRHLAVDGAVDPKEFDAVFDCLWTELGSSSVTLRQVVAVNLGFKLSEPIALDGGVTLTPYEMNTGGPAVWDLLDVEHQRDILTVRPDQFGVLMSHDVTFNKEPDGKKAIEAVKQLRARGRDALLALRLSAHAHNRVEATYIAQLSGFPLFPFHQESALHTAVSYGQGGPWPPDLTDRLNAHLGLVAAPAFQKLRAIAERFQESFRDPDDLQNVIDLVVAMEGLLDVSDNAEGLKGQCTMRAAALFGSTDDERLRVLKRVAAAYDIRSALVHGNEKPGKKIRTALSRANFDVSTESATREAVMNLVWELQGWIRSGLSARLRAPVPWPTDRWNEMVLNASAAGAFRAASDM